MLSRHPLPRHRTERQRNRMFLLSIGCIKSNLRLIVNFIITKATNTLPRAHYQNSNHANRYIAARRAYERQWSNKTVGSNSTGRLPAATYKSKLPRQSGVWHLSQARDYGRFCWRTRVPITPLPMTVSFITHVSMCCEDRCVRVSQRDRDQRVSRRPWTTAVATVSDVMRHSKTHYKAMLLLQ